MNATKAYLKEIYLKQHSVLPIGKYFIRLKECYNTLEELGQTEFEVQNFCSLLDHINFKYDQFNSCVHTARKDYKDNF